MPLSDEERQRLKEEEIYRSEVRRLLDTAKPSASVSQRVSTFLESKVGFWILTTLFAGLTATLYTGLSDWLNRAEIDQRHKAERARQDFDTVIKVVPMLTSENGSNRQIGFSLLNGLASANSIQPEIAAQITSALQSIVAAGVAPNAPGQAIERADELVRLVDAATPLAAAASGPPIAGAVQPRPTSRSISTPIAPAVVAVQLPPRVYVQIGSDARRPQADRAVMALRAAGLLAPGIERVATVPANNQLRYCEEKMVEASRDAVVEALRSVSIAADPTPLAARLCGNVRPNHFELWLANAT